MMRTLLASTALAALLTAGVVAQDTTTPADPNAAPATEAPAADPNASPADPNAAPAADADAGADAAAAASVQSILATGYTVTDKDNLATEIIGKQVYSSTAEDAEHIGDVNNLVIGENGEIAAVVIGVGGFLGIGEKNVAVNYAELEWTVAADNSERFVLPTTKEALESAPDFQAEDQTPEGGAAPAADATTPAAPADGGAMAPADNNAMAPADPNAAPADAAPEADAAAQPADNANAAPVAAAPVTGPIDRNTLTDAPLTAEELIGTNAYGPADEHLGAIGDVVLGQDGTTVEAVIIDFGGFLGIGTKQVAVAIENLRYATNENGDEFLFINVTREQLDQAPEYDEATFADNRDAQILKTDAL